MAKFITAVLLVIFAFAFFAQAAKVEKTKCPRTPSEICPDYVTEICIYPKHGKPYTAESNPCFACQNKKVKATSIGACP